MRSELSMNQILSRPRQFFAFLPAFALFLFLPGALLAQEDEDLLDRFEYKGSVFFQSFFLARDLPLVTQTAQLCPDIRSTSTTKSRCREELDFHRMRFRLNLAFRPSPYTEILYGMEVGYLTFGQDSTTKSGPGSGGQGSGRTNLETRELLFRLKNGEDNLSLNLGIFSFSTPKGLVIASSGGGANFVADVNSINSRFSAIGIRSIDNTQVDDDSNGFSDDNFSDIHLAILKWQFSGLRWLRSELYGVYRRDSDATSNDPTESNLEISRLYWGGLFLQFKAGRWKMILHGVGNWGSFSRPYTLQPPGSYFISSFPVVDSVYTQYLAAQSSLSENAKYRRKYDVNAGAGQAEISFQVTDSIQLTAVGAAGSGRLGIEPDGSSVDFRPDQFRTAGSSFQFSQIAVDTSGGYTLFSGGKLTGLYERGGQIKMQILDNLQVELGYYTIEFFRTPTIGGNTYYTLYLDTDKPTNYVGDEINAKLTWRALTGLTLEARFGYFNAGTGYKILRDVEYGDRVFESAFSVKQTF